MTEISRRQLLKIGAAAAGATAGASLLPPSVLAAMARPPLPGGLRALRHVVFLMQENRSFDHYFGTLRGVRGFGDPNAITRRDGGSIFAQPNGASTVLPFSVRDAATAAGKDLQYINDLDHSWTGGQRASAGGWHDGWIAAKTPATMAYYDRRDLPFHYELADTFTICDAYHCSVPSSTSPNRNYLVSGYTGWEPDGKRRAVGNDGYAEDTHAGYAWTTYAERLEAAGRNWKVYQEWDNYQDNNLELFVRFKQLARKVLAGRFLSFDSFYSVLFKAGADERAALLASLAAGVEKLDPAERRLYERAQRRVAPGGLAADLRADVAAGRLPEVSYLVPSAADSEHPSASSPAASASITYQVLDALASDPEVWASTALFITYDENDGFFDHVPPPRPPESVTDEYFEGHPIGLGVRVPMLVVSPWTVGGYVCSQVFDHSSLVRFVERWLDVAAPEISSWRRTVSGDLTAAFDFQRHRRAPAVEQPPPAPPFTGRWRPTPPAQGHLPAQEPGRRRARPLPYQPDAWFDAGTLQLSNTGKASAHLVVYPYAGEYAAPKHLDVLGRLAEKVPVRDGRYEFTVTGPNGFRREFTGIEGEPAAVESTIDPRGRSVTLRLLNRGRSTLTFTLRSDTGWPRRITVRPRGSRTVDWPAASEHGWYDLTIALATGGFHRRLAGHVENGRESVTG